MRLLSLERGDYRVNWRASVSILRFAVILSIIVLIIGTAIPSELGETSKENSTQSSSPLLIEADEIFDRMASTFKDIKGYKARVKIDIKIRSLGNLTLGVEGELYFRKPDKVQLKLEDVPEAISERYKTSFSRTVIPGVAGTAYKQRYIGKVLGIRQLQGVKCYFMLLIPRQSRSVKKVLMWVSTEDYTVPKVIIFYKDGGTITIDQKYSIVDGYKMISEQVSHFEFPNVKADMKSVFLDYEFFREN